MHVQLSRACICTAVAADRACVLSALCCRWAPPWAARPPPPPAPQPCLLPAASSWCGPLALSVPASASPSRLAVLQLLHVAPASSSALAVLLPCTPASSCICAAPHLLCKPCSEASQRSHADPCACVQQTNGVFAAAAPSALAGVTPATVDSLITNCSAYYPYSLQAQTGAPGPSRR